MQIVGTCDLRLYYPQYSTIDLVCGNMPSKDDQNVIMFAAAAFTGERLKDFKHSNTSGGHITGGKREKGFKSKRNTDTFVYYNGTGKFYYPADSKALDAAASNGDCGFSQEMILHNGAEVKHFRPASNQNIFRALCRLDGKLAIIDSQTVMKFGNFTHALLEVGVTEAMYLDMGGWAYS